MSRLPVRFHPAARREFQQAIAYYDEQVPELGDDLAAEVERVVQEVREYPELGSPYQSATRRVLVQRFPYSVIYRVRARQVELLAVAHHRRKPGYWHKRL